MKRVRPQNLQAICTLFIAMGLFFFSLGGGVPEARASQKLAIIDAGITTNTGATRLFKLELAETPAQRTKGLMGRKTLADNGGMLFVWPQSALRLFWMKNTPLSLDILFFNASGELVYMHQAAKPYSLETISSIEPAKYVVEIKAGTAKLLGIDSDAKLILKQPLPLAR